jgi:hypothetical protein
MEVAMCAGSEDGVRLPRLLRDPLTRLVMDSDGVTEQALIELIDQVRRSLAARKRQQPRRPSDVEMD